MFFTRLGGTKTHRGRSDREVGASPTLVRNCETLLWGALSQTSLGAEFVFHGLPRDQAPVSVLSGLAPRG